MKEGHPDAANHNASQLLTAIVESSDDAMISKDLSGTITSWNKAAEKIFGYEAAEVIGGPISILIPPERGTEEIQILAKIKRGERIDHFETVRVRKDGARVDMSVTISPLIVDGRIVGASKVARDITARKKLLRDLEAERLQLKVTLSSIGDGVIVSDADGMVTFMNAVAEALTGWNLESARNQPLESVFHIVNQRTRRRVENPAARALREGTVVGLANYTVLVSRQGQEYAIDDTAAPIRTSDGNILGAVLVFRDVSGSRAAGDLQARLATIVQDSDDAIISKDLNGHITSWNPAAVRLYGYAPEEAIGRPISMIIPPERLAEETDILARIGRGERIDHFETVRITKDRRKVHVSLTVSPVRDSEGNVIGTSKISRDITQRKQTETELAEAREELQKRSSQLEQTVAERTAELRLAYRDLEGFTYSVAHDLQSPVRKMLSLVSILAEQLGTADNRHRPILQRLTAIGDHMLHLIEELLKLSNVGRHVPVFRPTPLEPLVRNAIAEFKSDADGRNVEWKVESLPSVRCDPGLIHILFLSLLDNALKYTRPRTVAKIEIGQTTVDNLPAFYVRDNGIGFDMSDAPRLFELFERIHDPKQFEGAGIGLPIVERVVRKHGGRVWFEARPDQGATFFFTLPDSSTA
jgi:PAS domain S-box-containing protein